MLEDWFGSWSQRVKIRLVLAVLVLFLVSMVMSCEELSYMVSGKTVDANLVRNQIETRVGRSGNKYDKHVIGYSFDDQGRLRTEYEDVALDWPTPEGNTVKVQYLAGRQYSARLVGEHHWGWVSLFFGSLAAVAVGLYMLSRQK